MTLESETNLIHSELVAAAERARAAFDWETAVAYSGQALACKDIPPDTAFSLLDGQAEAHRRLGDLAAEEADLEAMACLADQLGDAQLPVQVAARRSDLRFRQGHMPEAQRLAQAVLDQAREWADHPLEAAGFLAMARARLGESRLSEVRVWAEQAAELYDSLGDTAGKAQAILILANAISRQEQAAEGNAGYRTALELFHQLGDREGEARALNGLGILCPDLAQRRSYYEQALTAFSAVHDRRGQAQIHNNLALTNEQMGLYALAREDAHEAVEAARQMGSRVELAYYLDTLARIYLDMGDSLTAEKLSREGLALAREVGDVSVEAAYAYGLARTAHAGDRLADACDLYQTAADLFGHVGIPAEQATCLAWMGTARLAAGEVEAALACTAQAIDVMESVSGAGAEYPLQETWWCRYRVLAAASGHGVEHDAPLAGDVWHALDRARETMLVSIVNLSDDGLRRNYLNKVQINRQIVGEWLREAERRGAPLTPLTEGLVGPGGGQEQFRRMLEIGLRLNARRESADLARHVVNQVVELTGAEQVSLYTCRGGQGQEGRMESGGCWTTASVFSATGTPLSAEGQEADDKALLAETSALLDEVALKCQALLRYLPANTPELGQRSILCVPLVAAGQLVGLIYASMAGVYGRFTDRDRDLLTVLANQAAVALENAQWTETLERRVEERTAELQAANQRLEERTAELTIVNRVGQGLAQRLEYSAIIELVGDEIRQVFPPPEVDPELHAVFIALYDETTQMVRLPYWVGGTGGRFPEQTFPVGEGLTSIVIQTQRSLVLGTWQQGLELGAVSVDDGSGTPEHNESWLGVPILAGDRVIGILSVSDPRPNHYTDGDVRLLSTLAANLGTALESARLFHETNRLLEETQQRTAELEIINSVQQALASQLDMQAIYDLVGDKIRDIFDAQAVFINTYDHAARLFSLAYGIEKGQRVTTPPAPFNYFTEHLIAARQRVLIDEDTSRRAEQLGMGPAIPGTEDPKSMLFVPLIARNEVTGAISLQNMDREHAFSDSDVRLLTTLASSMSVALENARLFDQTNRLLAETQQRTAELEIINSVQQGLAAQLDFQAIYDLIADKIRDIFDCQVVVVASYDQVARLSTLRLALARGQGFREVQTALSPFAQRLIATRSPVLISENAVERTAELGIAVIPDPVAPRSMLLVPLLAGNKVTGSLSLQNTKREHAFGDSDVRLLTTLANSMSVALENARLFDETNRLLEETRQRTAELQIINRMQHELAAQLDIQAICELIGDGVRDIFDAQAVAMYTYDQATRMSASRYVIERGRRFEDAPYPIADGSIADHLIRTRQLILINENAPQRLAEFGVRIVPGTDEPKSMVLVPLIARNEVIGSISLQNLDREHAYSDSDVRLFTTLASSMSVALENARLFDETNRLLEETRQRTAELSTINRVSEALTSQLELDALVQLVGEQIRNTFQADIAYVALLDREAGLIHFPYQFGERLDTLPLGEGLTSRILLTGQPLLLNQDVADRTAELGAQVVGTAAQSYLGAPIPAGGETIGVLSVQSITEEGRFDDDDLRLLSTLAANVGAALQNARLYQETQRRAVEMAALAEIGSDIASTHEMKPVLERLAARTRELLRVRDIALYLVQPDGHTLRAAVALGGYVDETLAQAVILGEGITGHVAQSGVAEIVNYPEQDPRVVHISGTPLPEEEPEGLMLAPLVSRGRVIGVMSVWRNRDQGLFAQHELDFLVSLARQAAIAIDSARLYAETERRATEMAALAQVGREISATLDLPVVLERIAGQARELLTASTGAVYLLQPDGYTLKAIAALGEATEAVLADETQLGQGIIGQIVQTGAAERIDDTTQDPRGLQIPGTDDTPEGEKLLVAPLLAGREERAIGALAVWRNPQDPPFDQAELSFSIGLAQQAAVAIENARLYEAAQESQRRMADIIDFLPDATLVIDREGTVIAWNRAIEQMTGVPAAEMVGKGTYEYAIPFYGERRPILIDLVLLPDGEVEERYAQIERQGSILMGEALVPQLRGQSAYLYANASALRNSRGETVGAIETIRDISDRKLAEEELRQAKATAESATQAKSAFLATMSHEIRTPMNAVIGMTSLLLDTPLNADQREFAETIRSSGDALLAVINDILDFSKIEAGRIELERQPFDLRECVERALGLVARRAAEKGLELSCWIDPKVPAGIAGDETRLGQVLLNLLTNAIKFTDQGEVALSVNVGEGREAAEQVVSPSRRAAVWLHFAVRDTGLGIPPDRMDRLFQSFSQVDSSTTRKYGGTGLGLAISQRLTDLMGGRIWAESAGIPGLGSTFHLAIHLSPAETPARAELQVAPLDLRGRRALIVDDNATSRRILTLQTEAWGMAARVTGSPAEALEWLRHAEPFDVAILDRQMPEMDGMMLAAEIRRLRDAGALPLVMISSLGRGEAVESRDFAAYLVKPIRASQLYNALVGILSTQASAEPFKPVTAAPQFDAELGKRVPLRILLAEDNVVNQKLALRLLDRMGYRADLAANGVEAVQAVERQQYDVILMDVQMPEMDGLEATRTIVGRWAPGRRPRIVAMTANALAEDREACLAAGMDDYLSKPIRVEELVAALGRCQSVAYDA
jgi:PAS domain S-box-containing protein